MKAEDNSSKVLGIYIYEILHYLLTRAPFSVIKDILFLKKNSFCGFCVAAGNCSSPRKTIKKKRKNVFKAARANPPKTFFKSFPFNNYKFKIFSFLSFHVNYQLIRNVGASENKDFSAKVNLKTIFNSMKTK